MAALKTVSLSRAIQRDRRFVALRDQADILVGILSRLSPHDLGEFRQAHWREYGVTLNSNIHSMSFGVCVDWTLDREEILAYTPVQLEALVCEVLGRGDLL